MSWLHLVSTLRISTILPRLLILTILWRTSWWILSHLRTSKVLLNMSLVYLNLLDNSNSFSWSVLNNSDFNLFALLTTFQNTGHDTENCNTAKADYNDASTSSCRRMNGILVVSVTSIIEVVSIAVIIDSKINGRIITSGIIIIWCLVVGI